MIIGVVHVDDAALVEQLELLLKTRRQLMNEWRFAGQQRHQVVTCRAHDPLADVRVEMLNALSATDKTIFINPTAPAYYIKETTAMSTASCYPCEKYVIHLLLAPGGSHMCSISMDCGTAAADRG